ncbi:MAG: crossover junction endodeoxyribonuclease RuvC [Kiritimatiellia bacterium]|nr:crossover junction endodeoxyribonuclease RuvC [Kiritimatiellia bacterium]
MTDRVVHVLGVDTSLRSAGVGVVGVRGNRLSSEAYSVLKTPAGRPVSECLRRLSIGIVEILDRWQLEAVAIEGAFFQKNARTAMILGEARGTVIAACACRDLPIFEYAPRRVKQAVVGFGSASKEQVRSMVLSILGLREKPPMDASDALAIAVCHVHSRSGHKALMPEPI